jgi:D-serine dehydratase
LDKAEAENKAKKALERLATLMLSLDRPIPEIVQETGLLESEILDIKDR